MAALPLLAVLMAALFVAGCGLSDDEGDRGVAPRVGVEADEGDAAEALGFPVTGTKNTTRVGGADEVADAAGVASAVYPATSAATRPKAVALVDKSSWQAGVAAAVLASDPIDAPVLLTDGAEIPPVTADTIERLDPPGSQLARDAEVILVGDTTQPPGERSAARIPGSDPYRLAAEIDKFSTTARGEPSEDVIVASGERAEFAMPAAAWAAFSGDSVFFVEQNEIPGPTREALERHDKPDIFILGPESAIGPAVEEQLGELGRVDRIAGETAVATALELARYERRGFGWGLNVPGNSYTLAHTDRPLDAAAAAALARNGVFAPLLLTDEAGDLPRPLESYFLDVQPGFEDDPTLQAGSNYVWILGDESAVSSESQGRIDEITELVPVNYGDAAAGDEPPGRGNERDRAQPDRTPPDDDSAP